MKSQFFKDMQGLDTAPKKAGRISVCLLLNRELYLRAADEAARLGLTSGQYLDRLLAREQHIPLFIAADRAAQRPSDSP